MSLKLISELNEQPQIDIQESNDGQGKEYYIEGVFLQAEKPNRNKRIYPEKILENEVDRYIREYINTDRAMGELGHPEGPQINLHLASHKIMNLEKRGTDFYGKAKLLDTPNGKIAKNLIDEGIKLGVSSRGLGSLKVNEEGVSVVQEDFYLATAADIVSDPSAPDAFVDGIMEGKEWVYENGVLKERDIEPQIEKSKKRIIRAKKSDLEDIKIQEFEKYLRSLDIS